MPDLQEMKCVACQAGEPTLTDDEAAQLQPQLPDWQVKEVKGMKRDEVFGLEK